MLATIKIEKRGKIVTERIEIRRGERKEMKK